MLDPETHVLYWLWLSLRCPPGQPAGHILLEHFQFDPVAIYEANKEDYEAIRLLPADTVRKLCDKSSVKEREIYYWCLQNGVNILTMSTPEYPGRLLELPDAPLLLYVRGKLPDVDKNVLIAAVGTRRYSEYGRQHAYTICYDIARCGGIVVSGMARGIDSICHRGALDAGGLTIAVLGCGIDRCYPPENGALMEEIAHNGAIVTEYPPTTPPEGRNFPVRNRIISGLCQGTLVIEADEHSGALITAKRAYEQGRQVFALPGDVGEAGSQGPNLLIREGAIPVTEGRDVVETYEFSYPTKIFPERAYRLKPPFIPDLRQNSMRRQKPQPLRIEHYEMEDPIWEEAKSMRDEEPRPETMRKHKRKKPENAEEQENVVYIDPILTDELQQTIYHTIVERKEMGVDELVELTGATAAKILTAATFLEIQGVIETCPGGRYRLI